MKRIVFCLFASFLALCLEAQNQSVYMNGPVKLIADKEYGKLNNWNKLFNDNIDTVKYSSFIGDNHKNVYYSGPTGDKKIIVSPDGSVLMSHRNRYEIWKFGTDGTFQFKIGSKGSKPGQFVFTPSVMCLVGSKYLLTSDAGGRLNLFDRTGKYIKTITLKYSPRAIEAIDDRTVLLSSYVVTKKGGKDIVVNLNVETGKEKILIEYPDTMEQTVRIENIDSLISSRKGNMSLRVPGFGPFGEILVLMKDGRTILTNRKSANIRIYDQKGTVVTEGKMEIEPVKITQEDVQQNYEIMKNTFSKSINDQRQIIERNKKNNPNWSSAGAEKVINANQKWLNNVEIFRDIKNYYPYFPYYSHILQDDEGNLLCFEFTSVNDKASNRFNVIALDMNGKRLARTSFVCDDYELTFSSSTFVISKGFVYAVAKLKNTKGMPLRLVKFRMEPLK